MIERGDEMAVADQGGMGKQRAPGDPGDSRQHGTPGAMTADGGAPVVDSAAFARARSVAEGRVSMASLSRLAEAGVAPEGALNWSLAARSATDALGRRRDFLDLAISFAPVMTCARCLEPVALAAIEVERRFRFAPTERQAEIEDRDEEEIDVLAHDPAFDLAALVEDEAILALPMFVAHEHCPEGHLPERDPESTGDV